MRRLVDIIVAVIAIIIVAPALVLVAGLILLEMGRPFLFYQGRAGINGKTFTLVKFRTMRDADYHGQIDTERISALGRFLRASALDELPQLWNILRGDMSLIGPRPALPLQAAHFSTGQRRRLTVRPGLTGWAQVNGRNAISWTERIELDLWYLEHRSLALDLTVLFRTVARVVRPTGVRGENGVNEGFRTESGELIDIWTPTEKPLAAEPPTIVEQRQQSQRPPLKVVRTFIPEWDETATEGGRRTSSSTTGSLPQ